ncbi:MAG: PAS domain-containing sensor histidine kinase [Fibrobacterales bacterium]
MVNKQENELFKQMVAYADVGLVGVGADGVVLYANPCAQKLLGGLGEERLFDALIVDCEGNTVLSQLAMALGEPITCYPKVSTSDAIALEVSAQLFEEEAGFVVTLRKSEVTKKSLEKKVFERAAQLEKINSDLNDFAYVVSHDLKTPLRAIYQLSSWIIDDYGHLFDDDGREQMGMLCGRVEQMNRLIDGVLLYSRAGKENKRSEVDMNSVYDELHALFSTSSKIRLIKKNEFPLLLANKTHLVQLFQNIISNAEKYMVTPAGGLGVVTIEYQGGKQYERFIVSDTGPGIPKEHHEEIFKMFTTVASHNESSGVGLAIVKKLMHRYEGSVSVTSELNKGSCFILDFKKSVVQCGVDV